MNQDQKKYLVRRIDDILKDHIRLINGSMAEKPPAPNIVAEIKAGRIKIKPVVLAMLENPDGGSPGSDVTDRYVSIKWRDFLDGWDKIKDAWEAECQKVDDFENSRLEKVKKYAQSLKDTVVFGSDEFALKTIEEFSKMVF